MKRCRFGILELMLLFLILAVLTIVLTSCLRLSIINPDADAVELEIREVHPGVFGETVGPALAETWARYFNFWARYFTEPIEIVYFRFHDETACSFTSHLDGAIEGPFENFVKFVERQGKTIADIDVIIHNHFKGFSFSGSDIAFYRAMFACGFRGRFMLYQPTGRIIEIVRKEK